MRQVWKGAAMRLDREDLGALQLAPDRSTDPAPGTWETDAIPHVCCVTRWAKCGDSTMNPSSPALGRSTVRPTAASRLSCGIPTWRGERGRGRMQPWSVGMDGVVTMADLVRGSLGAFRPIGEAGGGLIRASPECSADKREFTFDRRSARPRP